MKVSGYVAVAVMTAGAALMPSTASAAVFTLDSNSCVSDSVVCDSFTGLVKITITDVPDSTDLNFLVENTSNGAIDKLGFNYAPTPTGSGNVQITAGSVGGTTVSFDESNNGKFGRTVVINFPAADNERFDAHETVSFTLHSSTKFAFDGISSMLAHVFSLDGLENQSVWLTGGSTGSGGQTVPEPASIALFGFAALAAGRRMRRRTAK